MHRLLYVTLLRLSSQNTACPCPPYTTEPGQQQHQDTTCHMSLHYSNVPASYAAVPVNYAAVPVSYVAVPVSYASVPVSYLAVHYVPVCTCPCLLSRALSEDDLMLSGSFSIHSRGTPSSETANHALRYNTHNDSFSIHSRGTPSSETANHALRYNTHNDSNAYLSC